MRFFSSIQSVIDSNSIIDEDSVRKAGLMYGITLTGIVFLVVMGIIGLIDGGMVLATLDFLVALALLAILFVLHFKGLLYPCIYVGLTIMYMLYMYLFISGGIAGTAFLWSYTFPLFSFFLLGTKKGLMVSLIYLLSCISVLTVDLSTSLINLYNIEMASRFVLSFSVVILFSLIYERYRENSQSALVESRNSLEQKVAERTQALEQEIKEKQEKEQALQLSEARYRTLYEHSGDGISIIGLDGKYISVNQQFCRRLGYSADDFQLMDVKSVYPTTSRKLLDAMFEEVLENGSGQFQVTQVSRMQKEIPVEIRATRINYDGGDAILCSCRDISKRKQEEEEKRRLLGQLHKAQKMEAIGAMAGGVAHDLNNILAGIVNYPEMLLRKLPEDSELRGALESIQISGQRAVTVVDDMLTVAKGVANRREHVDINSLIADCMESAAFQDLSARYPEVRCSFHADAKHAVLSCSEVHIRKALMNLIVNGMEAIEGPGTIRISTANRHIDGTGAAHASLGPGHYLMLLVEDSGSGIGEEELAHVFEPFYTRKVLGRSGTGLGLTVVWNTVQDHGGTVTVRSDANGTCFTLFFPVEAGGHILQQPLAGGEQIDGNGERILVVDDEPLLRDIACSMLASLNYTVNAVASGEEAVEFLKEESVDLLVLDMLMEPGMNGRQTYEEILKTVPEQKAIIVSGYSASEDVNKALELGAGGFVKKPFTIEILGQKIWDELNS